MITPPRAQSQNTLGTCTLIVIEPGRNHLGIAPLAYVIQLAEQRRTELMRKAYRVVTRRARRPSRCCGSDTINQVEIYVHLVDHSGPAHLHDDVRTVGQCRGMDLTNRGCCDRDGLEAGERLVQRPAKRSLDGGHDLSERYGRGRILKARQLGLVVGWYEIRARGQHLPELHERRPELLEGASNVDRTASRCAGRYSMYARKKDA